MAKQVELFEQKNGKKGQEKIQKLQELELSEDDSGDSEDDAVQCTESPYIDITKSSVYLISPTFGDKIRIRKPKCRFGTSKLALKELKHVEEQIMAMGVLPDFGYDTDNYILDQHDSMNKWRLLTGLIGDGEKFSWLMGYIKV